jgi:thioredoxin 1
MSATAPYATTAPTRAEIDSLSGAAVLEFGTDWCGYCRGAQPLIADALGQHAGVRHIKVEDGPGRPLGRSFRVKLWPTLVFLSDGTEVARVVRPTQADELDQGFAALESKAP